MVTIKSVQKREPQSNSSFSSRDYIDIVSPESFNIKVIKINELGENHIRIFFPRSNSDLQGIELELAAPEAIAICHALLGVALGNIREISGHF